MWSGSHLALVAQGYGVLAGVGLALAHKEAAVDSVVQQIPGTQAKEKKKKKDKLKKKMRANAAQQNGKSASGSTREKKG